MAEIHVDTLSIMDCIPSRLSKAAYMFFNILPPPPPHPCPVMYEYLLQYAARQCLTHSRNTFGMRTVLRRKAAPWTDGKRACKIWYGCSNVKLFKRLSPFHTNPGFKQNFTWQYKFEYKKKTNVEKYVLFSGRE